MLRAGRLAFQHVDIQSITALVAAVGAVVTVASNAFGVLDKLVATVCAVARH
jgi:hypothetical protein